MTLLRGTLTALSTTVAALLIYPAYPAGAATARDSQFQQNLEATVRYLQDVQHEDGGFAEPDRGEESDFSAWVALALAAAGINPRDQSTAKQHWAGGHSAYTYLAEHAHEASSTTDFERELLVVDATGSSPYDFGGVDLAGEILARQITQGNEAGAFAHQAGSSEAGINDTIFAILALSPIHEQAVQEAVTRASEWLQRRQNCDGSWNTLIPREVRPCETKRRLLAEEAEGEVDMTGAAIQALDAAGRADRERYPKSFEFLHEQQLPSGGFSEFSGEHEPNVASTAWIVQAMWSAAVNPETWVTHSGLASEEPLGYLASMQQEDGHIRWETSQELNGMWMTAYVTPAFTGNPLPIPEVPYEELPTLPPEEPVGHGDGGVSTNPGNGVIAGGDGNGAQLFSRPQPASKGHTPGGARQLKPRKHDRFHTHKLNPGTARKTPVLTATTATFNRTKQRNLANHKGTGGATLTGVGAGGGARSGSGEVQGILIGAPTGALEPGAPSLHGAGAGENRTSWLAIGIGSAAVLLAVVGSLLELRRPRVIL